MEAPSRLLVSFSIRLGCNQHCLKVGVVQIAWHPHHPTSPGFIIFGLTGQEFCVLLIFNVQCESAAIYFVFEDEENV